MSVEVIGSIVGVLALILLLGFLGCLLAAIFARKGARRRPMVGGGVCVGLLLAVIAANYAYIFWVFLPRLGHQQQEALRLRVDEASKVRIGQQAPSFRVKTLDGGEFDLEKQGGKVVLLSFFATWCGPCLQELPHLEALWKEHGQNPDFTLLVVDREETADTARAFVRRRGFTFPVAADPKRKVYSLYAKELIPRTLLLSRDGSIAYSSTGFYEADLKRLREMIAKQLASGDRTTPTFPFRRR